MADNEIKVKISGEDDLSPAMKKALESMEKLTAATLGLTETMTGMQGGMKKSKDGVDELDSGMINLAAGLEILKTAGELAEKAFEFLKEQFKHCVEEALAAEVAQNRLNGALIQSGNYTTALSKELGEYAEHLQSSAGANAELVKNMVATGLQMGLNVEQAKEMEQAARQLAASAGIDVNQAFSTLTASLSGQGRALSRLIPQVKELGAAQLKSGEAIKLVTAATKASYDIYQQSLPVALAKATSAFDDMYKSMGQAIIASPALKSALSGIANSFGEFADFLTKNKAAITDFVNNSIIFAVDALNLLQNTIDVLYRTGSAAFNSLAAVVNGAFAVVARHVEAVLTGLSLLPGSVGKAAKDAAEFMHSAFEITAAAAKQNADNVVSAVQNQTDVSSVLTTTLLDLSTAAEKASKATGDNGEAMNKASEAASQHNRALLAVQATYDGFSIGTFKQREQLKAQVEDRQSSLKDFTDYLENHKRLALDKAEEERQEVDKVRNKALEGAGGSAGGQAKSNVEVDAEIKKQADLQVLHDKQILNDQQYGAAMLASRQQQAAAMLEFERSNQIALADALGESPEAFQMKQQESELRFQLELQNKMARAAQEGATDAQINAMREAAVQENLANMAEQKEQYIQKDIEQNERLNNQWEVTLGKIRLEQQKHGAIMGTIQGVAASGEFKAVQGGLNNLANLRSGHSKSAFEAGKKAAIASATINTFLSATEAFSSLAMIPIVGPVLGAAAAAAAIASGFVQIQNINAQKFDGGQADEGMDSVPSNLSGKSFVLSQGERVVQPSANKDLTEFLNSKKQSGGGGGGVTTINIQLQAGATKEDMRTMVDRLIPELRAASERGTPILNEKAIIKET